MQPRLRGRGEGCLCAGKLAPACMRSSIPLRARARTAHGHAQLAWHARCDVTDPSPPRLQVSWPPSRSSRRSSRHGVNYLCQARSPCPSRPACNESAARRRFVRLSPSHGVARSAVACPCVPLFNALSARWLHRVAANVRARGTGARTWTITSAPGLCVRACPF